MMIEGPVPAGLIRRCMALCVLVAACSGADDATTTTMEAAPITTTIAPSSTTTATTSPSTTTTTTTTSTTTTTTGPDPAEILALQHQGLGTITAFGQEPAAVVAALSEVLGVPDEDTGWIDAFSVYGTCPMPEVRMVRWGNLQTFHTTAPATLSAPGADGSHFFHWRVSDFEPAWVDLGLRTVEGIGLGDTAAVASGTYGVGFAAAYDDVFEVYYFSIVGPSPGALGGTLDGGDPTSVIRYLEGGVGCGE